MFKLIFLIFLIFTAVMDFKHRRVKNWLVLAGLFFGLLAPLLDNVWLIDKPIDMLIGFCCAVLLMLPAYIKGWMGAGDVKFFAVLAAWVGFSPILLASFLGGSLLAFLHSISFIYSKRKITNKYKSKDELVFLSDKKGNFIPYAGYMAVSCILWMCYLNL